MLLTRVMDVITRRSLLLIALLAAFTACSGAALLNVQEDKAEKNVGIVKQAAKNVGVIKAKVIGILHFEDGRGYFISVGSGEHSGWENRVWLWVSEDKVLIRQLEGLSEKKVIAKGELEQMPENVRAAVPPYGMYLKKVEVEGAPER